MDPVRGRASWGLLVLATLIGGCGGNDSTGVDGSTTSTSALGDRSTPLVVDTDLAGDDIVALAYLASNPRVDLLAVSVSGTGEVTCPRGAEIATALLAELGRRDVPVACGVSEPLSGNRRFPSAWREAADNAWELELREVAVPDDAPNAVALLTERISSAARPVTVLTLGPLTNVAQLLTEHPDLIAAIARVVVMGGAVDVPGNVQLDGAVTPLEVEWNFYVDPRAADVVVASSAPVTLVTLDATNSVPVTDTSLELLTANDVTSATAVARHVFERYPPPYLWDPLAAIAVSDPDLMPVRNVTIDVVTEGAESGRTIEQVGQAEVEMLVAPDDPAAIVRLLVQVLARVEQDELITPTTLPTIGEVSLSFDGSVCRYEGPERPGQGNYLVDLRPGRVQFWGVIAQLVPGTTMEKAAAWIVEHPNEQPPMIEEIATIGEGVLEPPGSVAFRSGTVGVACLTEDNMVHVATSVEVRP
jgi:inosine-uridine nucleoside N-ribohydrolase